MHCGRRPHETHNPSRLRNTKFPVGEEALYGYAEQCRDQGETGGGDSALNESLGVNRLSHSDSVTRSTCVVCRCLARDLCCRSLKRLADQLLESGNFSSPRSVSFWAKPEYRYEGMPGFPGKENIRGHRSLLRRGRQRSAYWYRRV